MVFRLSRRELEALQATVRLRSRLKRSGRSLTADTPVTPELRQAQDDLHEALTEHREELAETVDGLLQDPERCAAVKGGAFNLTLSAADSEQLLQALNQVRVGAWESLGSPDFESGDVPEPTEANMPAYWALQLTDAFLGLLLSALQGDD